MSKSSGKQWIDDRIAELPAAIAETLRTTALQSRSCLSVETVRSMGQWDVIGMGGSEGPARLCVAELNRRLCFARLVPTSRFLDPASDVRSSSGLIVFSQGLSPHARLALARAAEYQACVVVSARSADEVLACVPNEALASTFVESHPPAQESGSLLRVVGPACASVIALHLAWHLVGCSVHEQLQLRAQLAQVVHCYEHSVQPKPCDVEFLAENDPVMCLALGADYPSAHQFMWKWQETTCSILPPVVDALAFAHGPFQALFERAVTLVALQSGGAHAAVWQKLEQILVPARHRLVRLHSDWESPFSYFSYDAQFLRILSQVVSNRGLELSTWPGQGADQALYELGPPAFAES